MKIEKDSAMYGVQNVEYILDQAQEIKKRATDIGFDVNNSPEKAYQKIKEEYDELGEELEVYSKNNSQENLLKIKKELGDVFFALCALCNKLNLSAKETLELTNEKFVFRNFYVEKKLKEQNLDFKTASLDQMCKLWQEAKKVK